MPKEREIGRGFIRTAMRQARQQREEDINRYSECFDEDGVPDTEKLEDFFWWLAEDAGLRDLRKQAAYAEEIRRRQPSAFVVTKPRRSFWQRLFG